MGPEHSQLACKQKGKIKGQNTKYSKTESSQLQHIVRSDVLHSLMLKCCMSVYL